MSRRKLPRAFTADVGSFVLDTGEIVWDQDLSVPLFGDGVTPGGLPSFLGPNLSIDAPDSGDGFWAEDTSAPKYVENPSRSFFGIDASDADSQVSGTNWVSVNFNHYLIRSNTTTNLSKYGGTASFSATRNGDRYRQPALSTVLSVWVGGASVTDASFVGYLGRRYYVSGNGNLGGSPPTHDSGTVANGSVLLTYIDNRGQYFTPIADSAFAWSEVDDGEATWSRYTEIVRGPSGGISFGNETGVKNRGSNVIGDPYNVLPVGATIGDWFAGGSDGSYGGAPANPSTVAIAIGRNSTTWNTGIYFGSDSLATLNGRSRAIGLASNHAIQWFRSAGQIGFEIRADSGANGHDTRIVSNGTSTEVRAVRPNGVEEAIFGINQPDMSAVNSRANQFFFNVSTNTGVAGNGWIKIQSAGYDNNVDIMLEAKGLGLVSFGAWLSNADTAITGYVTIKDLAGNVRKLATIA